LAPDTITVVVGIADPSAFGESPTEVSMIAAARRTLIGVCHG
jgi:hypothetical protein